VAKYGDTMIDKDIDTNTDTDTDTDADTDADTEIDTDIDIDALIHGSPLHRDTAKIETETDGALLYARLYPTT